MSKFRIRSKHRRMLKKVSVIIGFILIIVVIAIGIANYRVNNEEYEAGLLLRERESYEERTKVVAEVNQLYDYSSNGYMKLASGDKVNVLVVSDTEINEYNRYQITANWQDELNEEINLINGKENQFNNILLRGSNIMWAYMQVSSDLKRRDYDFAIIDMTYTDVKLLSSNEYKLYYEAMIRQLYKQFEDIQIYVVYTDELGDDLSDNDKSLLEELELWTMEFNNQYMIETISLTHSEDIAKTIIDQINTGLSKQIQVEDSIVMNPFNDEDKITNDLFRIDHLEASTKLVEAEGFMINDGLVINDASDNYLLYEVIEEFVFINYVKFKNGAIFEVYIDEILYTTIDSYSEVTGVGVLALPPNQSKRNIKIMAISEPGLRRYMMMDSLLVGKNN